MFTKTNSSEEYNRNEQCFCNAHNISYKIIENYRSILDRKQQLISTWKIFDRNGKISFTHGTQYRKGTDALVIRLNHICLINPWYKYINVNKHLLSIIKNNRCYKVFEIILLEYNCLKNLNEYELAIIECPCLEQMRIYCSYCRLTLAATEQPSQLFKNVKQQTNISFSLDYFNDEIELNGTFHSQSGPYQYQRTVQIQVESEPILHTITESTNKLINLSQSSLTSQTFNDNVEQSSSQSQDAIESEEDLLFNGNTFEEFTNYQSRETQTKLFAILLPESPLSEMKAAKTEARTSMNVTRICQVNTLSYLIKTNESQTDLPQINCSSSTSFLYTEPQLIEELSIDEKPFNIKLLTKMQYQTFTDRKYDEQEVNIPIIQFEGDELLDGLEVEKMNSTLMNEELLSIEEQSKEFIFTSSLLKCINACNTVDLDEPNTSVTSFLINDDTITRSVSSHSQINNSNNNCEQITSDHLPSIACQSSKLFRLKNTHYRCMSRKRRRYRNKRRVYSFFQCLRRRKQSNTAELLSTKQHSSSSNHHPQDEYRLTSTQINSTKYITSSNRQQPSIIDLHLDNSDTTSQYKSVDHIIIARATKSSIACKELQALVNNDDTLLEQLIDSQLELTCRNKCKSVCILIDDHKQSEQYRSSFLHYIYTTLSNTLKKIIHEESVQLTCMNLAFFNNSLCDIINMRRLRLIDTGRKIILLPSCEIPLKTSDDINMAINRLSTNMLFAHQIFIINFYHEQSSIFGSFFFLQLAPICSIRPTGLLTNLNSTTYSVLNLIRQFNNGQLFHHNAVKRYLLNDCSLNRLLKNYLFSSQQTMTVMTVKQREIKKI